MKQSEVKKQVRTVLTAANEKKAENITILELPKESSAFTDYFVICTGSNPRQVQAISDEVEQKLSKLGVEPNHREGHDTAEWILLDYVDFVVHIFSENARKFYDLERLWKSAKRWTESELKAVPAKKGTASRKTAAARRSAAPARKTAAKKTLAKKTVARKAVAKKTTKKPVSKKPRAHVRTTKG
ncbi:MAG TPA: ribosome silencing factor [Clostridia bacterium]|nr:ribosome silencing factor [Clostridia bacterium]